MSGIESELSPDTNYFKLFQEAFERADSRCRFCRRSAYLHVHGPNQSINIKRCSSHLIAVEKNGTISLAEPLATILNADKRPNLPIAQHPLGYSSGPVYGRFAYGVSIDKILSEHGGVNAFVCTVIQKASSAGLWQ